MEEWPDCPTSSPAKDWNPIFTEAMIAAIRKSLVELQQWMSWAQATPSTDELRQVLLQGQMAFDANQAWEYAVFETEAEQLVGGAGLHQSDGPDRLEMGTGSVPTGPAEASQRLRPGPSLTLRSGISAKSRR